MSEVHVKVENHQGTIYLSSDELPGFWLWGRDPDKVFGNIIPTIVALFKHNKNVDVQVRAKPPKRERQWSGMDDQPRDFLVFSR